MCSNPKYQVKGAAHNAFQIDDVLSKEECQVFIDYIDSYKKGTMQSIEEDRKTAVKIWNLIKSVLDPIHKEKCGCAYELVGVADFLTISKHRTSINIHLDERDKNKYEGKWRKDLECLYKIGIYLNDVSNPKDPTDVSGGTSFYSKEKELLTTIKPKVGKLFGFNMKNYHSGHPFDRKKLKYLIGIRLLYKKVGDCNKPSRK